MAHHPYANIQYEAQEVRTRPSFEDYTQRKYYVSERQFIEDLKEYISDYESYIGYLENYDPDNSDLDDWNRPY